MAMRVVPVLLLAAVVAWTAACGDTPTTPTASTTPTSPVTESFSSQLAVKGTASRAFTMPSNGTATAQLSATTPGGIVLGFGFGIPRANGAGCLLSTSVDTAASGAPQLIVNADAGSYCVQVYDLGTLTDPIGFTVSIVHP